MTDHAASFAASAPKLTARTCCKCTVDAKGDVSLATVSSSTRDAPNNALNDDATRVFASTVILHALGGIIG